MKNLTQADVARLECALEVVRSDRAVARVGAAVTRWQNAWRVPGGRNQKARLASDARRQTRPAPGRFPAIRSGLRRCRWVLLHSRRFCKITA